jgi:UDP:flavonoid glycosyltransferase YjiC (YdhE family)
VILFFPFDLLSHNLRCLQLAEAIRHDYEVKIAASARYNSFFKEAGIGIFPCQGIDPSLVMKSSKNFDFSWMRFDVLEQSFLNQVTAIRKYNPEAVVGDASFTLRLAAAYTNTPYVSVINGYMSRFYARTRRLPLTHPAAKFSDKLPENVFNKIIDFAERVSFRMVNRPFIQLARKYKTDKRKIFLQELEGDLTLIVDHPELFPQKNLPDNFKLIGPLYYESDKEEASLISVLGNGRKNILVSMGSSGDWEKIRVFASEKFHDFNIIMTPSVEIQKNGWFNVQHIYCKDFINVRSIIHKIDILICHGGNGTVYQGLQGNVPVLCIPDIFEQEWNLQGLEAIGLGERLENNEDKIYKQIIHWIEKKDKNLYSDLSKEISVKDTQERFREVMTDFLKHKSSLYVTGQSV